jgi:hypothetical protein
MQSCQHTLTDKSSHHMYMQSCQHTLTDKSSHHKVPKLTYRRLAWRNNNGFCIWWLGLLAFLYNYYSSQSVLTAEASLHSASRSTTDCKVKVTLRLAVYRQSVRLGTRPLETHDQRLFSQLNSCGNSACVTSSLTRRWVCLLWICLAFRQLYISHIQHVIKNSSFCTTHKSSVSTGFTEIMPNLRILCYNGSFFF